MTTRSVPQRLAAWLMVALLALIVGEPLRAHYCPMHDGAALMLLAAGATTGATTGATHGATHGAKHGTSHAASNGTTSNGTTGSGTTSRDQAPGAAHAGSGADGDATAAGEHSPAQAPHGSHNCQCLGACCLTTPVTAPEPALASSVTTTLAATVVVAPAVPVAVPGTADVVLPFAIGPPQAV